MISGPTPVRKRMELREFIRQRAHLIESGLVLIQEDLDLSSATGSPCVVDALARDALGTPTFVFAAEGDAARTLPTRLLEVDGWFRRHGESLLRALADAGYKNGAAQRFLIVAFELEPDLVERLERLGLPRVEVLQICSFMLRNEMHYDVEYVIPRDAGREVRTGVLPSLVEPRERELCTCLLDLLQRMDPRVGVNGDRFSRRFALGGATLCVLRYDESGLAVTVHEQTVRLLSWDHVVDAIDLVLRSWHLGVRDQGPEPAEEEGAEARVGAAVPPFARQRISLAALRRSVAASRLTSEEAQAFTRPASGSDPI